MRQPTEIEWCLASVIVEALLMLFFTQMACVYDSWLFFAAATGFLIAMLYHHHRFMELTK